MRVRIVCYEDVDAWILGKFARRLHEQLVSLQIEADIAKVPDPSADINHHIIYLEYEGRTSPVETLMITHIDDIRKLNLVKRQLQTAQVGICMSEGTMIELANSGIPREKLAFINPAHDEVMQPRKIKIGITSKVQPDGCKRETMLLELSEYISPANFEFVIMGFGWEPILDKIKAKGFSVTYYPEFNYKIYLDLIPVLDYYLYLGMDEGSMGFMDALAAGVKTIVTPQGYHLDADCGITHAFVTIDELISIFNKIAAERQALLNSIASWNWRDYALKHLEIWHYLIKKEKGLPLNGAAQGKYKDGLNSLLNLKVNSLASDQKLQYKFKLYKGAFDRTLYKLRKIKDFKTLKKKIANNLAKRK
ncbi:hypothetical protein [Adhaeribacter rhizoryzae]|uniref:Uncharacterized protein n=1 Tax=Adhaeribacter rhizoryzae TaxID=2607907 RepID=A0A5M6DED0_9BACT|nr:hypothetical protein [Adhaeribacter rhizoryzae]KAA5544750.1 hypothetical protein F0145_13760 [Adhaeribacter rhizoryzae]